jgi:hypothetical protein
MRHITSTISAKSALQTINTYSNQHKSTYVRIADRKHMELHEIAGTPLILVLHTNVYSKTWSKTTAKIWLKQSDNFVELPTRAAVVRLLHAENK